MKKIRIRVKYASLELVEAGMTDILLRFARRMARGEYLTFRCVDGLHVVATATPSKGVATGGRPVRFASVLPVVSLVAARPVASQNECCKALGELPGGMSRSTARRLIREALDKGFILAEPNGAGRSSRLFATAAGEAYAATFAEAT